MKNIIFVCYDPDNHCGRGVEYTNILFDMVARNISKKESFQFHIFSNKSEGYHEAITVHDIFERLSFENAHIIFLTLNMAIVGGLDDLFLSDNKKLDECFKIYDYKKECQLGIPPGAKIIEFSGVHQHEVKTCWVPHIWKIGGGHALELEFVMNVEEDNIRKNIALAMQRPHEHLSDRYMTKHTQGDTQYENDPLFHVCIVGGGPSLKDNLQELRLRKNNGQIIWALNGTLRYLCENSIYPDFQVILDARADNAQFIPEKTEGTFLIASQCHPDVFDKAEASGGRIIIWHRYIDGIYELISSKRVGIVGSGTTVGMNALGLAKLFGFKYVHLYGFDSSYEDDHNHAYSQPLNDSERVMDINVNDRKFRCAPWMASQVEDFKNCLTDYINNGMEFTVHGRGLLPYIASMWNEPVSITDPLVLTYDLGKCPASWDFFAWLMNIQFYLKTVGNPKLQIYFKPGGGEGFRINEPVKVALEQKQQLLDNVCRPLLKLFGADEAQQEGVCLPCSYTMRPSVEAYRNGGSLPEMILPQKYMDWAKQYEGVITITLRESDYWPERNSNLDAWIKFSEMCPEKVVFIRDTKKMDEPLRESCPEASADIFKRLAIYRTAKLNFFVSNGPFVLALSDPKIPYICFVPPLGNYPVNTDGWWRKNIGIGLGEQYPWATKRQKIIVSHDTCEAIQDAYQNFLAVKD